ncbi:MAG TPA: hypothetical protein VFO70_00440 [Chitinophagaceae bacterium]|nr:hypothetical protein [Chitinophagaceae bacterium]
MKAKDLFTVILKVFGIYLIKDVLLAIPPILANLHQLLEVSAEMAVFSLFVSLLVFGLYLVIVYLLLFRTAWLISKLRLASGIGEEPLAVNLHRSSVYTIAIIVTGLLILVFAIPQLVRHFYGWYEYMDSRKSIIRTDYFDYSQLLTTISELIVGLLFLGNQRILVNYIETRRRASKGG